MNPRTKRAIVMLFALTLLVAAASLFYTSSETDKLRAAVQASCAFAADLGGAPVALAPSGKASRLGVSIVADSRAQWHHLGCPGQLPPPTPSFMRWARYYHLPAS